MPDTKNSTGKPYVAVADGERHTSGLGRFFYLRIYILLVVFLVFANGINNGFNIDDGYYTTEQNQLSEAGIRSIYQIFTTRTFRDNNGNYFDYRPIPLFSFAVQHDIVGTAPVTSHFINVLLFGIVCVLVFELLCRWLGVERSWFAFLVTVLYAVHPLHTEVVDSLKSRDELLASLFSLLCMLQAWRWHSSGKPKHIAFSLLFFLLGLLCKNTVVLGVAIMPLAFYFFSNMSPRRIAASFALLFASGIIALVCIRLFLPEQRRVFLFLRTPFIQIKAFHWQ